jgi:hypothetical protein
MSMTPKDGVFYVGVMLGLIAGSLGAKALEIHHLIGLAVGVFGGAGLGYAMQQLFFPNKPDDPDRPL